MRAEAGLTQRETQIAELLAWGAAKKGSGRQAFYFAPDGREYRTKHL